ncbi:MAG: phosphatidylserine decarboxylase family protein [Candidatus Zixiibacteriota bacterium]|nr:MAG: phosphatidylserine decarboxylase family protein [candidate division Zixibacteria bacterium]
MIARDGIPFVLIGLVLTLVLLWVANRGNSHVAFWSSLAVGILTIFVVFFFRDPERECGSGPGVVLAPADGTVVAIEKIDRHPFVGKDALKVSVFLSVLDVHVNRVPASGVVDFVNYNRGKFLAAYVDKASKENEQSEIGMTTIGGHRIVFKQIAGLIARRIVCRLNDGDTVRAGDRFGMIRFGSRADLILPAGSSIRVQEGEQVYAGRTIIGMLDTSEVPTDSSLISGSENFD